MDTPSFVDGLGRRLRTVDSTGDEVETLRLCREVSDVHSAEAALVERAGRLTAFDHPSFAQVRRVERLPGALGGLAVVSTAVPGLRLSELLTLAQRKWTPPDPGASLYLLDQIASALAAFHRHSRELAHGALGPERIVIRPDGRPVVVEHVLASAIGQLEMGRALLWTKFRIPVPAVAGTARLDQMTDITQLGVLALAIVLGRLIRREEYPQKLQELLAEATTPGVLGARPVASRAVYGWILRTLQIEARTAFRSAADAAAALAAIVAEQPRHSVSPASVLAYLAACQAPTGDGAAPGPIASAAADADQSQATRLAGQAPAEGPADSPRSATIRLFRLEGTDAQPAPRPHRPAADSEKWGRAPSSARGVPAAPRAKSGLAALAVRASRLEWPSPGRAARIAAVSLGLAGLFGATYLGARGYLDLSDFFGGRGTLVVESHPSGADLYVDGLPSGRTPATLQLRAGEHTLALRSGRATTLVPVVVVSGARRVERVEMRQRRPAPVRPPSQAPAPAPVPTPPPQLPATHPPQ